MSGGQIWLESVLHFVDFYSRIWTGEKCSVFQVIKSKRVQRRSIKFDRVIKLTKLLRLFKTAVGSDIPLLLMLLLLWCFLLWFCSLRSFSLEPLSSSARSSGDAVMFFGVSGVLRMKALSGGEVGIRISSKLRFAASFSLCKFFFECLSLVSDDVRFGAFSTDR